MTDNQTTRRAPIPHKGIKTNEDEARWLERTIRMRMNETLGAAGINSSIAPIGLYDLLLLSLDLAGKRAIRKLKAEGYEIVPPKPFNDWARIG